MTKALSLLVGLILAAAELQASALPDPLVLFDLRQRREVPLAEAVEDFGESRVVLVGERHTTLSHHEAQLAVVKALEATGRPVAIGFEMFRAESQPALDRWVSGQMTEAEFEAVYFDNWNYPWPLYRMLLAHARDMNVPAVGLNVPREITRQVAKKGFRSLSDAQRGGLPLVTCEVDEAYMRFIREAHGAHGHGGMNFTYFCEAQLVWDKAMAAHAVAFLEAHPETTMVIVAGTGHARKGGIPLRIREISDLPQTVLLPEIPGVLDRDTATAQDADFLILGLP